MNNNNLTKEKENQATKKTKQKKHADTFMELQHDYNRLKAESCIHFFSCLF